MFRSSEVVAASQMCQFAGGLIHFLLPSGGGICLFFFGFIALIALLFFFNLCRPMSKKFKTIISLDLKINHKLNNNNLFNSFFLENIGIPSQEPCRLSCVTRSEYRIGLILNRINL